MHSRVGHRLEEIEKIAIETQESAKRIIDKTGPLDNPADRDHCIQYMVAVPLVKGSLVAEDYENAVAADPRIDALRAKMEVVENADYTRDYLDPAKRSIGNAVQVFFRDGSRTERIAVEYPIGHRRRRSEGIPVLLAKFEKNLFERIPEPQAKAILALCKDPGTLHAAAVSEFMDLFVTA